ncbi:hypothetical protein AC1031_017019 [Aphanomyces cochlioides]|nr:hypothetical protein AC1031_017019 [Aphanomyces cochlioides]
MDASISATAVFDLYIAHRSTTHYGLLLAGLIKVKIQFEVLLTDPEAIKHVLTVKSDNYPRANSTRHRIRIFLGGDGLLSIGFSKVRECVDIFARNARQLSNHLKQVADQGVAVDVHDFFTKMTLDVIGVAAFGYNFGSLESANDRVLQAYNMLNQSPKLFYLLGSTYIPGFANWPLPRLVKQREAKRILHEKVANVIESKLQARRDPSRPMDENADAGQRVTAEEAITHVMTFMLAGHETTSATLSWVFAMFAKHPEMESIARKECQAVAAASEGGQIGWKSLAELKYTTAFIHETLRMFPAVANVATRECASDDVVPMSDGKPIFIPKGTTMFISSKVLERTRRVYS